MRIALYPGSFDPITNGHVDIVSRAANIFDQVVVAVAQNRDKRGRYHFSDEQRVRLATASLSHLQNVKVVALHGLVASYAEQIGAVAIVKGLRNGSDLDSEAPMAFINTQLGGVEPVFLPAAPGMGHISSALVKDVASYGGNIDSLVPSAVATALKS